MAIRRDDADEESISLTSMMDVVFLLLLFFLVTASMKKPHKELQLDLPNESASVKAKAPKKELIISIDKDGGLYLDNKPNVSRNELIQTLQETKAKDPQTRIRIDCDRRAQAQHITMVMNLCMLYNLNRVGVRTKE